MKYINARKTLQSVCVWHIRRTQQMLAVIIYTVTSSKGDVKLNAENSRFEPLMLPWLPKHELPPPQVDCQMAFLCITEQKQFWLFWGDKPGEFNLQT